MKTKLTLNIDEEIISSAKTYAKNQNISLSKLIENFLKSLIIYSKKENSVSPLLESLIGIIPSNVDERKEYRDYIDQKYS